MEIGVNVWVRDTVAIEAWISGTIVGKTENEGETVLSVHCESGAPSLVNFRLKSEHEDNPDLKLRNSAEEEHVDNLIKLPFLNEPAILHCLQERYYLGLIYTYTGPILIAVNPFKPVNLYTKSILDEYYNKGLMKSMGADVGTELAPHVYAIADNAYRQMMGAIVRGSSEKIVSEVKVNQSILISGESGAGKTESTKVVLSYLTTVGRGLDATDSFQGSIMEKVLQSNPILEAFGNAKTKRNDNSSRFGKFIQLNFNRRGNLIGGSIKTYLLEKVRLPLQQIGERNFHIFYQLVSGSSEVEKVNRGLRRLEEFNYTSKSGVYILSNVNDAEEYESLCTALSTLNFDAKDQQLLFDIVSGILHLGQLWFQSFTDGEGEGSILNSNSDNQYALQMCTALLGLAPEQLLESLTIKQIVAAGETYFKKLTKIQAADARDALSKAIYGKLFDWLVRTINSRIEVDASNARANIGVLDIFGFESFAINSFEQLCINYANEALQQQFNQFIFKLEQTEYEKEKIEWHFISFPDNKDCLELIEHRVSGIIAMLDDECRLPKASDEKFAARSYKEYATNPRFSASAPQKRSGKFSIHHYAGQVEYTVATFVEKNKDELPKEANSLLQSSTNRLLNLLFRPEAVDVTMDSHLAMHPGKRKPVTVSNVVQSVGSQFKDQLNDLMGTIYATSPHYIRCLKPNDQNVPDTFTRLRITEQLRYGGVLEAVRVARSGFPVRLSHEEFYRRYRMLVFARLHDTPHDSPAAYKAFCVAFVNAIAEVRRSSVSELSSKLEKYAFGFRAKIRMDGFQVGLTKLFLRKECHDYLETSRYRCIHLASVRMQAWHRANRSRLWFRSATYAARLIQRCVRGNKARQLTLGLRRNRAALIIQKHARCFICRRRFNSYLYAVTLLQAHLRRRRQRNLFVQNRQKHAGQVLIRALQLYLHRCYFLRIRKAITILKGKLRVSKAKILLRQLRLEAKDLGRLQENNETLKKEIEELKSRAAEERQRLQQEFERRAQETLMAANKVELETLRTRLQEAEQLLHEEKQHGKEKGKKLQQSLQDSHSAVVSASQEGNALCWKCRERRIDDDPLLPSPVMHSPNEAPARRRSSRRSFAGELRNALSPETISPPGKHHQSSIGTAANKVHIEDFKQANERLQGEVTRLRGTNIEHLATIENLRREMQLMKEEEDKLRQELAKKRPLDHLAQRQRRGSLKVMRDISADRTNPQQSSENAREDQPIASATASAPTTSWVNTWDAEDDDNTSESGSVQDVSSAYSNASSSVIASVESAALQSVEKNLDKWKSELIKGVKAVLWERQKVVQADVTVKLDTAGTAIQFVNVQQRYAFGGSDYLLVFIVSCFLHLFLLDVHLVCSITR
jgi:myosin-5